MKKLLYILLLLTPIFVHGQKLDYRRTPNGPSIIKDENLKAGLTLYIPHGTNPSIVGQQDSTGAIYIKVSPLGDTSFYFYAKPNWIRTVNYNVMVAYVAANTSPIPISNPTTGYLTPATLNATYPSARKGQKIICEFISDGPLIYIKGATLWYSVPLGQLE